MTHLVWRVPFSEEHNPRKDTVAHLIDVSQWLSRRLCLPELVNTHIATPPRPGVAHCKHCLQSLALLAAPRKVARYSDRRREAIT